jgi:hypothetical protein
MRTAGISSITRDNQRDASPEPDFKIDNREPALGKQAKVREPKQRKHEVPVEMACQLAEYNNKILREKLEELTHELRAAQEVHPGYPDVP